MLSLIFLLIFNLIFNSLTKSVFDYSYKIGSTINIVTGKLSSTKGILPFSYKTLKICDSDLYKKEEDTLGEILTGVENLRTDYQIKIKENKDCQTLCLNKYDEEIIVRIKELIDQNYTMSFYLDRLPAGYLQYNNKNNKYNIKFNTGIPIGFIENGEYYIYNHLSFFVDINKVDDQNYNIVGFKVLPLSFKQNIDNPDCRYDDIYTDDYIPREKQKLNNNTILFTYEVKFKNSDISIASRWDYYKPSTSSIHWGTIIISYLLVILVGIYIGILLKRAISKDIIKFSGNERNFDDFNWRNIAGDIFRSPSKNPLYLSSLIGIGVQLFVMSSIVLILGSFGFMNPDKRVNVLTTIILLYCCLGLLSGYISAKFYRLFGGEDFCSSSLMTSIIFPGVIIFGYIIINIILTFEKSNASVRLFDILTLFVLWFLCSSPLVLMGSFCGYKSKPIEVPCEVNTVPSYIPSKPWYLHTKYSVFIIGFLSFLTIVIELEYAMSSLWGKQIYFMATFLWIAFTLFIIFTSEISIVFVYLNLCKGDHRWWWKAFFIGSSPIVYFVIFSIYYFFKLKIIRISSIIVYFGVMILISIIASIITGSISTLLCFIFIKIIYKRVEID